MNSLISKLEFSQQFSFFIHLYYFIYFIYPFIYFSYYIIPGTFQYMVSGDRIILFACFFLCILREVKCKYMLIYIYIYIYIYLSIYLYIYIYIYIYVCIYIYPYLYKQNFFNNEKSFSRIPKRQNDNAEKLPGKTTF